MKYEPRKSEQQSRRVNDFVEELKKAKSQLAKVYVYGIDKPFLGTVLEVDYNRQSIILLTEEGKTIIPRYLYLVYGNLDQEGGGY